jgi:hypothetical protein
MLFATESLRVYHKIQLNNFLTTNSEIYFIENISFEFFLHIFEFLTIINKAFLKNKKKRKDCQMNSSLK